VEREGLSGAERCECANEGPRAGAFWSAPIFHRSIKNASVDNFVLPATNPVDRTQLAQRSRHGARVTGANTPNFPKPGLLFHFGPPGTAKTHLAVAALRTLILRGFEGVFFDFQALFKITFAAVTTSPPAPWTRKAYPVGAGTPIILVLDDLGAHRVTDWVEDTVTSIAHASLQPPAKQPL